MCCGCAGGGGESSSICSCRKQAVHAALWCARGGPVATCLKSSRFMASNITFLGLLCCTVASKFFTCTSTAVDSVSTVSWLRLGLAAHPKDDIYTGCLLYTDKHQHFTPNRPKHMWQLLCCSSSSSSFAPTTTPNPTCWLRSIDIVLLSLLEEASCACSA